LLAIVIVSCCCDYLHIMNSSDVSLLTVLSLFFSVISVVILHMHVRTVASISCKVWSSEQSAKEYKCS